MDRYYVISHQGNTGFFDCESDWLGESTKTWMCPACRMPRPPYRPVDAVVASPLNALVCMSFAVRLNIVRNKLLEKLGTCATEELLLIGRVLDEERQVVPGYSTVISRRKVVLRGNRKSYGDYCLKCGAIFYVGFGDKYLLEADVRDNLPLYEEQSTRLLLSPALYKSLGKRAFRGLCVTEVPVIQKPRDIFDEELPYYYVPRRKRSKTGKRSEK